MKLDIKRFFKFLNPNMTSEFKNSNGRCNMMDQKFRHSWICIIIGIIILEGTPNQNLISKFQNS